MKDEIYHYIPEEETFAQRLNARLEDCREAIIASAFFTVGAFQQFKPSLETALASGAKIKFLLGRFDFVTEPKAVKGLLSLASKYHNQLSVYFDGDFGFHYKLARFKNAKANVVFIGSSNLTPKGLGSIGEVNLEIVNNSTLFKQTGKTLNDRIKVALEADKYLDEYRVKYNQAKKYRRQRRNWEKSGQSNLTGKRRVKQNWTEPTGNEFKLCWVAGYVKDKTLKKNIDAGRKQSISEGRSFPNQWVLMGGRSSIRGYQEEQIFSIIDDNTHCLGFARCNKIIYAMDSNGKEKAIIFYTYLRGMRVKFDKERFQMVIKRLQMRSSHNRIGKAISTRLKNLLKKHRAKG